MKNFWNHFLNEIMAQQQYFTKIRNKIEIRTIDLLNLFKKQDEENMKKKCNNKNR